MSMKWGKFKSGRKRLPRVLSSDGGKATGARPLIETVSELQWPPGVAVTTVRGPSPSVVGWMAQRLLPVPWFAMRFFRTP
jgi:hypothetical protein